MDKKVTHTLTQPCSCISIKTFKDIVSHHPAPNHPNYSVCNTYKDKHTHTLYFLSLWGTLIHKYLRTITPEMREREHQYHDKKDSNRKWGAKEWRTTLFNKINSLFKSSVFFTSRSTILFNMHSTLEKGYKITPCWSYWPSVGRGVSMGGLRWVLSIQDSRAQLIISLGCTWHDPGKYKCILHDLPVLLWLIICEDIDLFICF